MLNKKQQAFLARVIPVIEAQGLTPPHPKAVAREMGVPIQAIEEIIRLGLKEGSLVQVGVFVYSRTTLDEIVAKLPNRFGRPEFRAIFDLPRSTMDPLMDWLVFSGVTRREDDVQVKNT